MRMVFTSKKGKTITFDNWEENDNWKEDNLSPYWVDLCPHHHNKYKKILGKRIDDSGSGCAACSVAGCTNQNSFYYVDFSIEDVKFID